MHDDIIIIGMYVVHFIKKMKVSLRGTFDRIADMAFIKPASYLAHDTMRNYLKIEFLGLHSILSPQPCTAFLTMRRHTRLGLSRAFYSP